MDTSSLAKEAEEEHRFEVEDPSPIRDRTVTLLESSDTSSEEEVPVRRKIVRELRRLRHVSMASPEHSAPAGTLPQQYCTHSREHSQENGSEQLLTSASRTSSVLRGVIEFLKRGNLYLHSLVLKKKTVRREHKQPPHYPPLRQTNHNQRIS